MLGNAVMKKPTKKKLGDCLPQFWTVLRVKVDAVKKLEIAYLFLILNIFIFL